MAEICESPCCSTRQHGSPTHAKLVQPDVSEVHFHNEHGRQPTTSRTSSFPLTTVLRPRHPARRVLHDFAGPPTRGKLSVTVNRDRSGSCSAVTMVRGHQCGVHCELCTTEQWQALCHNFQPSGVMHIRCEPVQVSNKKRSSRPVPLPPDRFGLPRFQEQNHVYPTLHAGGQKCRVDGHTGRSVELTNQMARR